MIQSIILVLFAILILVALYYVIRKAITLLINSLVGIVTLFLLNWLGVMGWFGKPELPINLVTILICAFGGIPGAVVIVILHLIGIQF